MLLLVLSLVATCSAQLDIFKSRPLNMSAIDLNQWWGPGEEKEVDQSIRPARIVFEDSMIEDLKYRLRNHREFKPPLEGAAFTYGFNTNSIQDWLTYWAEEYPFKEREEFLNQFPQYKTNVQGLDIHFIWIKQTNTTKKVVPLLLLHGWPGSIREFYEMIPLIVADDDKRDYVVELVVPCLPGFGFSDGTTKRFMGGAHIAAVMRNLMHRLGYKQYYLQGGDWGGLITSFMTSMFPDEVLGYHTNWGIVTSLEAVAMMLVGTMFPDLVVPKEYADRLYPLANSLEFLVQETGYFHELATRPDSVGVGMTDSPAGLLAYILEKFSSSVNPVANHLLDDGGLHNTFTREQIVDNLMMYWATRSFTTASRIYANTSSRKHAAIGVEGATTTVPTWIIQAKYEFTYQPPTILGLKYKNLMNVTALDYGGHLLALEYPTVLASSIFDALNTFTKLNR